MMLEQLLRLPADLGPGAATCALFCAGIVAIFVLYVGVAMCAVLRARDDEQRQIRYRMFRDLLDLFKRGKRR